MILEQLPEVQKLSAADKRLLAEELLRFLDDEIHVDPGIVALLDDRLDEFCRQS